MDTFYISKIEEHLADPSKYKRLSSSPTQAIRNDVLSTLNYLYSTDRIDGVTRYHLTPSKPARTPLFYGLPKIHKPNIPLRPIVSACDSPSDQLSNYVTHFIQPTSCGDTPLIHPRQQILTSGPWIPPTSNWERYFSNCCCHITIHEHTTWGRHRIYYTTWNYMPTPYPNVPQAPTQLEYYLKPSWRTIFHSWTCIFSNLLAQP